MTDAAAIVRGWNLRHKPGERVVYRKDSGHLVVATTRTPATVLGSHTAVIWLDHMGACVRLDRVRPFDLAGDCAQ